MRSRRRPAAAVVKIDYIAAAVVRVVANALGVPRGAVTVLRGERSRDKVISVDGLSDAELRRRLDP